MRFPYFRETTVSKSTFRNICFSGEADPAKYAIIARMMDHNDAHRQRENTWSAYQTHVVSFLREECGLADTFSEEEIFHALGVLDVNSVRINR